jgi:hypothetical protein
MKTQIRSLWVGALFAALPGLLQAQPAAHYPPGVEGIKGASLPPPGLYVRDYNYYYQAHRVNGPNGDPRPFDEDITRAITYGNIPRIVYISELKLLDGFVGVDALYPLLYQNVTAGGARNDHFGAGDLFVEGTLSWHPELWDLAVGAGVWMPTGNSGQPVDAGKGYWTMMFTFGATWYMDAEKTWALSALNRFEINSEQRDYDYYAGRAYTLEWGLSKTFQKVYDVGVVGYYQTQTTPNSGLPDSSKGSVAAIGPEFGIAFPKPMLFLSFRYLYEFSAENRAQGSACTLTLTKRF